MSQRLYTSAPYRQWYALLLTMIIVVLLGAFVGRKSADPELDCVLSVKKTSYRLGQVPELEVAIINKGKKPVWLIGSLDGSEVKWRMPYCYFTVKKPTPDSIPVLGCRTLTPLREKDFVKVGPGETFNPYRSVDDGGFFTAHEIRPETFRNPGIYSIRFYYSTATPDKTRFYGSEIWSRNGGSTPSAIASLLGKVPEVELVSNEIRIEITK